MRNIFLLIILLGFFLVGCRPRKVVTPIKAAIEKKDTVQTVIIKETPVVDSISIVKEMMAKVKHQEIDFFTFNAKIKAEYESAEESQNVTAYLSILKDSVMFIQIKGFLGIIGLQAKITKDSITIVNKVQDKYVQKRAITYLQDVTQIPFTFTTLQNLFIGNPIFVDSNIVSYKNSNDNKLVVLIIGSVFKNLLTIDNNSFLITHCKLDDVNINRNRTCDITLTNYIANNGITFSTNRSIAVSEKSKLRVNLDFKEYTFNDPIKYSFTIPKNYKVK
jgi:uncharacterized protein YcfL